MTTIEGTYNVGTNTKFNLNIHQNNMHEASKQLQRYKVSILYFTVDISGWYYYTCACSPYNYQNLLREKKPFYLIK